MFAARVLRSLRGECQKVAATSRRDAAMKTNRQVSFLTDRDFDSEVVEKHGPALVVFGAIWCGGSHILDPVIEDLSAEPTDRIHIWRVDADQNPELVGRYGIVKLPTLLFFKDGRVVDHLVGAVSKRDLVGRIQSIFRS